MTIAFLADKTPLAEQSKTDLEKLYGTTPLAQAEYVVVLGGDGFMLQSLRREDITGKKFFGMNRGTVGFLMNPFDIKNLPYRLQQSRQFILHKLLVAAQTRTGTITKFAVNDVSILRSSPQAAKIRIRIDGIVRMDELVCDGIILSTPAGSTAYNFSAHGTILPLESDLLALTPISPYRPRRWRGALIPSHMTIQWDVLDPDKRPIMLAADEQDIRDAISVTISVDKTKPLSLLFDHDSHLEERILREQFAFAD